MLPSVSISLVSMALSSCGVNAVSGHAHPVGSLLDNLMSQPGLMHMPSNAWTHSNITPLEVQVGFKIVKFIDLDIKASSLTFTVWIRRRWLDTRLYFNGTDFFGPGWNFTVDSIQYPRENVWKPDLYLSNAAEGGEDQLTSHKDIYLFDEVNAKENGWNMHWVEQVTLTSKCDINLSDFPFDIQHCDLNFESWMNNNRMITLNASEALNDKTDTEYLIAHSYQLFQHAPALEDSEYVVTGRDYDRIKIKLTLKRYPHYYLTNVIMPMALLEIMSCLTMWIPFDSGERLSYGVTGLLTVMAVMLFLAERRPEVEADTWFDKFQAQCCVICFLPVVYSVILLWWNSRRNDILEVHKRHAELVNQEKKRLSELESPELETQEGTRRNSEIHRAEVALQQKNDADKKWPKWKSKLRKLLSSDVITPTMIDELSRYTCSLSITLIMACQFSSIPEGGHHLVTGSSLSLVSAPFFWTIFVLTVASTTMALRHYVVPEVNVADLSRIAGTTKVWVTNKKEDAKHVETPHPKVKELSPGQGSQGPSVMSHAYSSDSYSNRDEPV